METKCLTVSQYRNFLNKRKHVSFLQSEYEYEKCIRENRKVELIGLFENNYLYGAGILIYQKCGGIFWNVYVPRGFVMDYTKKILLQNAVHALRSYLLPKRVLTLRMDPDCVLCYRDSNGNVTGEYETMISDHLESAGFRHLPLTYGYDTEWQCRHVQVLDLKKRTEKEIWSSFHSSTKRNIDLSEKNQVKVRIGNTDEIPVLDAMVKNSSERQKYIPMDSDYYRLLKEIYGDQAFVVIAEKDEKPIAASFFLQYRDEMVYLAGGYEEEASMLRASCAIQWYMIRKAMERGCTRYNFYGISGCYQPWEEGYGVYRFKRGFNAGIEEYIGNFILPINPLSHVFKEK